MIGPPSGFERSSRRLGRRRRRVLPAPFRPPTLAGFASRREHESCAGHADRMSEADRAAVDIQSFEFEFAQRLGEPEFVLRKLARGGGTQGMR